MAAALQTIFLKDMEGTEFQWDFIPQGLTYDQSASVQLMDHCKICWKACILATDDKVFWCM